MDDLAELKRRVDTAVDHLAVSQDSRRQQQEALVQLLADLEVKFDARHEELVYCHARISDLEQANQQLANLLNSVVDLLELGAQEDPDDPIYKAFQMANELVRLCDAGWREADAQTPSRPIAEPAAPPPPKATSAHERFFSNPSPARPEPEPEPGLEPEPQPELEPEPEPEPARPMTTDAAFGDQTFSDVSPEELEVEALLDDVLDDVELPATLTRALDAAKSRDPNDLAAREPLDRLTSAVEAARVARGAPRAENPGPSDAEILDVPGIDTVVDFDIEETAEAASMAEAPAPGEEEPDIKALLRRIQEAAEKARARAESGASAPTHPASPRDKTGTR